MTDFLTLHVNINNVFFQQQQQSI